MSVSLIPHWDTEWFYLSFTRLPLVPDTDSLHALAPSQHLYALLHSLRISRPLQSLVTEILWLFHPHKKQPSLVVMIIPT